MQYSLSALVPLLLVPFAAAQYDYGSGSSTKSADSADATSAASTDGVTVISVSDKDVNLVFKPDSVEVKEGDWVEFRFWPRNHSVVQSSFDKPCEPLTGGNGFYSGFFNVAESLTEDRPNFRVQVKNASAPMWFYCSQGQHCQGGMVGVINPPKSGERTLDAYKSASADADENVSPEGDATGGEVGTVSSGNETSGSNDTSSDSKDGDESGAGKVAFSGLLGIALAVAAAVGSL